MKKKMRSITCAAGMILLLCVGCLKTPDYEYVGNKEGQDTLILDNIAEDSGIPIAEQVQAPAQVTASCENVNDYTTIEIDAEVFTPAGTTVPVYTVTPVSMDAEAAEKYTGILYESGEFYNRFWERSFADYAYFYSQQPSKIRTSDEMLAIIEDYTRMLDSAAITDAEEPVWDEGGNLIEMNEEDKAFFEEWLAFYKEQYPATVDGPTYGDPVSYDFMLQDHTLSFGMIDNIPIQFDYDLNSATYTGLHNGIEYDLSMYQDGLNSELRFVLPRDIRMKNGYSLQELSIKIGNHTGSYIQQPNTCNYSQEEAVALCKDFMAELGIDNMEAVYVEDICLVKNDTRPNETFLGKKGWRIWFYWGTGGMSDCYSPEFVANYEHSLWMTPYASIICREISDMNGRTISRELLEEEYDFMRRLDGMAVISVLDDGIVDAWIQNPVENPELLAENVRLMSFDQVLDRGIAQLEVLYGNSGCFDSIQNRENRVNIKITAICLHYARMQNPNSEDEFAMIPVWDFKTGGRNGSSILSINAIDGTVFDREQGY